MTAFVRGSSPRRGGKSWMLFALLIPAGSILMLAGDSAGGSGAKEDAKTERIASTQDAFGKGEKKEDQKGEHKVVQHGAPLGAQDEAPAVTASGTPAEGAKTEKPATRKTEKQDARCLADNAVIDDIKKMRDDLDRRQKDLATHESELKAREKALDEELRKLDTIREEIAVARNAVKKENEEKVSKLVETFETMSPKSSSQLISSIDETLAVAAMSRMSTSKLAKILNLMEPSKSSRLTEILAGVTRAKSVALAKERGMNTAHSGAAEVTTSQKGGEKENGRNNDNKPDAAGAASAAARR